MFPVQSSGIVIIAKLSLKTANVLMTISYPVDQSFNECLLMAWCYKAAMHFSDQFWQRSVMSSPGQNELNGPYFEYFKKTKYVPFTRENDEQLICVITVNLPL